jgi:hypothetical protein
MENGLPSRVALKSKIGPVQASAFMFLKPNSATMVSALSQPTG